MSARAHGVLRVMGLSHHSHTMVGGMMPGGVPLRGLSGGQKRRLNIACRIVVAPPVVFLVSDTVWGAGLLGVVACGTWVIRGADRVVNPPSR